jgi:diguanylate cyclase (GGDEF)-like protein
LAKGVTKEWFMPMPLSSTLAMLDVTTLFVVAICVTGLLGVLLLFVWTQDRVRALAWWGTAYLIGGASVVIWSIEGQLSPLLPPGTANAMLFVACGMIWSAARLFHGRPVLWGAMAAGATIWFAACLMPQFVDSTIARIVLSSLIVATYTSLTAAELWRERRKHLLRRWPAIFVPMLHGLVFLCPIPLAGVLPDDNGMFALASGWIAVFTLEVMLYIVGTAFIVLVLSKERSVRLHKNAASIDDLTGVLNRRGFMSAARLMVERFEKKKEPLSVMVFDLDHFKQVNDRFGHTVGDHTLRLFALIAGLNMRASDVLGRLGGEEFVAILPGAAKDVAVAAERVRAAFQAAGVMVADQPVGATVSIGIAGGEPGTDVTALIAAADKALYKAKQNGRNRFELADEPAAAPRDERLDPVPAAPGQAAVPVMAS